MKSKDINKNMLLFSQKYNTYVQVRRKKDFMCLVLVPSVGAVWVPSTDLHEICPGYE